jgi:hypothetical protein
MKPYKASNKVPSGGWTWLTSSAVLGGLAIGGLTHVISLFVYLIVLFPAGMGLAGGAAMAIAVKRGKVRNPAIAGLFGMLTGAILYGTMFGAGYLQFKQEAAAEITKAAGQVEGAQVDQFVDDYLQEKTGATGFWGYVKSTAKDGISIGRVGSKGANLGEVGTWIYWIIEFSIIDLIIIAAAYSTAKDPFCEPCNEWYEGEEWMGTVTRDSSQTFLNLLQDNQFRKAGALINPLQTVYTPSLQVHLQRCSSCSMSDLVMDIKDYSLGDKGDVESTQKAQGMVSLSQYNQLQAAIAESISVDHKPSKSEVAEHIQLARQERQVLNDDRYSSHDLNAAEQAKLVEQFAALPQIGEAYLVRKIIEHFPHQPFYILGIVRRKTFLDSGESEEIFLRKLTDKLALPTQTAAVLIKEKDATTEAIRQVAETPIYQRKK